MLERCLDITLITRLCRGSRSQAPNLNMLALAASYIHRFLDLPALNLNVLVLDHRATTSTPLVHVLHAILNASKLVIKKNLTLSTGHPLGQQRMISSESQCAL